MHSRVWAPPAALAFVICLSSGAQAQTPCPTSAPDGLHKQTQCSISVDRDNPASPATIVVRAGTTVVIQLTNARANEGVTFTPTTTQTPPVDVAGTFLKSAINPLQSLVVHQQTYIGANKLSANDIIVLSDPIVAQLNALIDDLQKALGTMADSAVQLSCLEAYREVSGAPGNFSCSATLLNAGTFDAAKSTTISSLQGAAQGSLPLATIQDADKAITDDLAASQKLAGQARTTALKKDDQYMSTEATIKTAIGDAQKTQATMLETAQQLALLSDAPPVASFQIMRGKDYNSSVAIVAQEVISKTNTTVATVVVDWQANPWEVSTGIMFSWLKSRGFSNAPLIVNGQQQLDSGGKGLTVVAESDTRPTIVAPLVMLNYRLRGVSDYGWQNRCPGHCAFLLSGGVGLNIPAKAAEFAVGPSFQIGALLLTAAAHIGRDTELTQAVGVGAQLGSSPPSPLPTASVWVARFGFVASYVLPFQ